MGLAACVLGGILVGSIVGAWKNKKPNGKFNLFLD